MPAICSKLTVEFGMNLVKGTNETGFTALPGGKRDGDGEFAVFGEFGYWWSATEFVLTIPGNGACVILIVMFSELFLTNDMEYQSVV